MLVAGKGRAVYQENCHTVLDQAGHCFFMGLAEESWEQLVSWARCSSLRSCVGVADLACCSHWQ
eukprot:3499666-Rhodomonas_salina.2